MGYLWHSKYSAGGSQVVTFVHWAEQQWILNLLLFLNLFDRTKFASTSVVQVALLKTCQIQCPVPPESPFLGVPLPSALQQTLFFQNQVLRSKDQRLCNEKPTKLHLISKHQGQLLPIFAATTIRIIVMVYLSQDFKLSKGARNTLAVSQAISTDNVLITSIDF